MVNGKKKDYLGMLKIRGTIRRESVIESQSDILVERINIIEISQSVYRVLLDHQLYGWNFLNTRHVTLGTRDVSDQICKL